MEVSVKLTSHAKERMQDRFKHALTLKDIAEALVKGEAYFLNGRYYIKYKNICLVLASRQCSESDLHLATVLNLRQNKIGVKRFVKIEKPPFKRVKLSAHNLLN